MLLLLFSLLLTQVPCEPTDSTVVCGCKQGSPSACAAFRETDPRLAAEIEKATTQSKPAPARASQPQQARAPQASETPKPQASQSAAPAIGQEHHAISRPIAEALEKHRTLRGLYKPRDPRFVTRAAERGAHNGYQDWHRKVDQEVIDWLEINKNATPQQFLEKLREIYSRPEMLARFPHGL